MTEKEKIRRRILAIRSLLSLDEVTQKSGAITHHLLTLFAYQDASTVHCYVAATSNEVETRPFIEECLRSGRALLVPVVDYKRRCLLSARIDSLDALRPGRFGLYEPDSSSIHLADPSSIDLVVVPGIAFDSSGNRIGFGGGYYDRFLRDLSALKIGIAYQCQVIEQIVPGPTDVPIDLVVTEERVYNCKLSKAICKEG